MAKPWNFRVLFIAVRLVNVIASLLFLSSALSRARASGLYGSGDMPVFATIGIVFLVNACLPLPVRGPLRRIAIIVNILLVALGIVAGLFGIVDPVGLFFAVAIVPPAALALAVCLHASRRLVLPEHARIA